VRAPVRLMPSLRRCLGRRGIRCTNLVRAPASRCPEHGGNRRPFETAREGYRRLNPKIRKAVLARDRSRCVWCGSAEKPEVDHIVPQSKGGSDVMSNLRVLCHDCHAKHTGESFGWHGKLK
jgi:5-methylcytosine-specific restriction endonuclease McrA